MQYCAKNYKSFRFSATIDIGSIKSDRKGRRQTDYVMKRNYRSTLTDVEKKEQAKLNKHFAGMF